MPNSVGPKLHVRRLKPSSIQTEQTLAHQVLLQVATLAVTPVATLVVTTVAATTMVAAVAAARAVTTSKRSKGGLSVVLGPPFFVLIMG